MRDAILCQQVWIIFGNLSNLWESLILADGPDIPDHRPVLSFYLPSWEWLQENAKAINTN